MKSAESKNSISQLSVEELIIKHEQLRRTLFGLRLNRLTAHVKDYSQFNKLRKDIARVLTRLNAINR